MTQVEEFWKREFLPRRTRRSLSEAGITNHENVKDRKDEKEEKN